MGKVRFGGVANVSFSRTSTLCLVEVAPQHMSLGTQDA